MKIALTGALLAGAGQGAADHRQEIDQKRGGAGNDGRDANALHGLGPARFWSISCR